MDNKILLSYFPGIGDQMQFSSLPRRFTELGYSVYLSSKSTYRNPEIGELVWGLNPYIIGESDESPNCGDGAVITINHAQSESFIQNWEMAHGLPPPYSKYPEIYYEPRKVVDVFDKILIDITSTSGQKYYEPAPIRKYILDNCSPENSVVCCFHDGVAIPMLLVDGYPMVFVESLKHYCDLIASCRRFVVLHSGGMVLASALRKYGDIECDCLISSHPIHTVGRLNKHHFYDNINYIDI